MGLFCLFVFCLSVRSSDVPLGGTFQQTSVGAEKSSLGLPARNGFKKQGLVVFTDNEGSSLLMRGLNQLVNNLLLSTEASGC